MLRLLSLILSLFCAAGLAAQDDLEARLDAVKEFKRYFKKAKEEALMLEAIETLRGNECVPAAQELIKLLKHKHASVQDASLKVLESYKEQKTFQELIDKLPDEKDGNKVALWIKVVGQSKIAGAVDAIEIAAGKEKATSTIRYEAIRALTAIGKPGKTGLFGKCVDDKEAVVRAAACDAIATMKLKDLAKPVIKLLEDPQWQVQSAAIEAVASTRPQDGVQPLIDLMRKSGRLRTECADALFRITAMDFGVDPDKWQAQWKTLMSIEGWRIPTDAELAQKIASRKKYDAFYGKKEETNSFVGIPTTSTNVLFVIDQSGSMDNLVVEVDKFRDYKDRKRFTIVQTELMNTIDSLSKDTNFNIVAFATDLKPWKKRLVPANVVNRDSAKAFVRKLKPIGGVEDQELAQAGLGGAAHLAKGKTNTLKALLYGFGIDPDKPPKKKKVTGFDKKALTKPLDTMYFLSDGRPSVGKLIEPVEICEAIRKYNEQYRLVIHTIAIGDFQKGFLEQLAMENGGVFVDLGR